MKVYRDGKRRHMVMDGSRKIYRPHRQIPNIQVLFRDQFWLVCRLPVEDTKIPVEGTKLPLYLF